jgi:hypothetical protein
MAMIAEGFQLISNIGAPALETLRALAAKQVPSELQLTH